MKTNLRLVAVLLLCASVLLASAPFALAAVTQTNTPPKTTPGLEAAKTLSMITGVAISPLLGVGAVGAYQWYQTPPEKRATLNWFAQPWFWVPALLLVAFVAAKDVLGTAAPAVLKKPFDVAEAIENKISGLIAAGAFVPLIISVFPHAPGTESHLLPASPLSALGFAAIDSASVGNALLVPFAIVIFAFVWLTSHAINVLIIISPFTTVDAALKAFRLFLLSTITATALANPYVGAALSVVIIIISYFLAGWSFRLTTFGTVYIWDFVTLRRHRFQPGAERNWMFTARKLQGAPIRTYGKLLHTPAGKLEFAYRPWLVLKQRRFELPEGRYIVGRGLFYPEIDQVTDSKLVSMFALPPRFRTHEEAVARAYQLPEVRDIGLRRGVKAVWNWLKGLFGLKRATEPSIAAPVA